MMKINADSSNFGTEINPVVSDYIIMLFKMTPDLTSFVNHGMLQNKFFKPFQSAN
jgi:hypothetical protein